ASAPDAKTRHRIGRPTRPIPRGTTPRTPRGRPTGPSSSCGPTPMRNTSMPALRRLAPLLWLSPAVALIGVVVLWPVVVMVQSSFQQIGGEGFVAGYTGTA